MKIIFLLLITILLVSQGIIAQKANPLDNIYTPPDNSPFGSKIVQLKSREKICGQDVNNLKVVVTDILRYEMHLVYERNITPSFNVAVSFGLPLGNDIFENNLNSYGLMIEFYEPPSNVLPITTLYKISNSHSGYIFSTSLKYYINEDYGRSTFFEFSYKQSLRNFLVSDTSKYTFIDHALDFKARIQNFSVLYGFLWTSGKRKIGIVNEFSIGLSFKKTDWDLYLAQNNSHFLKYSKLENKKESYWSPMFLIRYQVGIGW